MECNWGEEINGCASDNKEEFATEIKVLRSGITNSKSLWPFGMKEVGFNKI